MSNTEKALEQAKERKLVTVFDFLEMRKDQISKALPSHITPDRMIGVFTMLFKSSPELMNCDQTSLVCAVIQTVQLGLEPGNVAHCYYVPFQNKKKNCKEVQFILGYKGIIELISRSGKASILNTEVVYQNDFFEYELGLNPVLKHLPTSSDRGEIIGVYCVAKNLVANEKVFIYLHKEDIDKVRRSSKAGNSDYSPWKNWYEEMAKKTAVRRISKLLPLSVQVQREISTDETTKRQIDTNMTDVADVTEWTPETPSEVPEIGTETAQIDDLSKNQAQEHARTKKEPQTANLISDKQRKRLFAISKQSGVDHDAMKLFLGSLYGITSTSDIQREWYEEICAVAEKQPEKINAYMKGE